MLEAQALALERLYPVFPRSCSTCWLDVYQVTKFMIEEGHNSVLMRKPFTDSTKLGFSQAGKTLPRVIMMGGDHTIALPLLRSINKAYGPVTVIHFDNHLWVLTSNPGEIGRLISDTHS